MIGTKEIQGLHVKDSYQTMNSVHQQLHEGSVEMMNHSFGHGPTNKRDREPAQGVEDAFESAAKKISLDHHHQNEVQHYSNSKAHDNSNGQQAENGQRTNGRPHIVSEDSSGGSANVNGPPPGDLKPYPFYYYVDHSRDVDDDPMTPLTPPGRVPNFPAKMHAILSRDDLSDIISWMPHGRSWRILKPREFEVQVIPAYFKHSKFTSFIRQANGWGFRRITEGRDRNSYYHCLFLRGMPHLCKKMNRPGVSEKHASDPDHEPDLQKISELYPVPQKTDNASILHHCTLQPKARVPVFPGLPPVIAPPGQDSMGRPHHTGGLANSVTPNVPSQQHYATPAERSAFAAFQHSLNASEQQYRGGSNAPAHSGVAHTPVVAPPNNAPHPPNPMEMNAAASAAGGPLALANQMAFPPQPDMAQVMQSFQNSQAGMQGSTPAAQFAAGFAAAAALSQQQFQAMMASLGAGSFAPSAPGTAMPGAPGVSPPLNGVPNPAMNLGMPSASYEMGSIGGTLNAPQHSGQQQHSQHHSASSTVVAQQHQHHHGNGEQDRNHYSA